MDGFGAGLGRDFGGRYTFWRPLGVLGPHLCDFLASFFHDFFIFLAFLNELVWRYFGQDQWVNFKTFGLPVLSLLFFAFQYRLFQKYLIDKEN